MNLIFMVTEQDGYYYHLHFTDKEIKGRRDSMAWPRPPSWSMKKENAKPRLMYSTVIFVQLYYIKITPLTLANLATTTS